jgi:hypothetical protein
MMDEDGLICTFSSSSWGGKTLFEGLAVQYQMRNQQAYPVVKLSSRPRGDQFGTIDPMFLIDGWVPASQFAAITGGEPEQKALAAPDPGPEKSNMAKTKSLATADLHDEIPF